MSTNATETSTTPLTSTTPIQPTTSLPATTATPTITTPTTTRLQTTPTTTLAPITSIVTASSVPPSTQLVTSVVVATTSNGSIVPPSTVVVTVISTPPPSAVTTNTASQISSTTSASSTSTSSAALSEQGKSSSNSGKLTPAGTIAIAVVIPIVVIAALVFAGLFFWRRRKQQKVAEEERRREMEAYGFNPNDDPTLPAVGGVTGGSEMMEDDSGYRGWGTATTTSTNRKPSTTLSSGLHPSSDGGYHSPGSPNASDQHSGDPLVAGAARRSTMDSETIGAMGAAPVAAENIRRGPSNASSSYSMGAHSNGSNDAPIPVNGNDYYTDNMYYGGNPYDSSAPGQEAVIRDNPARRNTQIQRNNIYPQQGSSGIAQNF